MIRTAFAALALVSVTSTAWAQEPADPPVSPARAQVRERMAIALLDLCQSVTDGAHMANSPYLVALGSPTVTGHDDDPRVRQLMTDDGVQVSSRGTHCSVWYVRPDAVFPAPDEGVGDELSVIYDRLDDPEAVWTLSGGDFPYYGPYVAADFQHWLEISVRGDYASIGRYLSQPQAVRAYFEAIKKADARSAPEAILAAPDACAALLALEAALPEDSDASRMADELPEIDMHTVWGFGRAADAYRLRGDIDSSLTAEGSSCLLQVNPESSGPGSNRDAMRSSVLALLAAPLSGWSALGENSWIRIDGARLSLSDTSADNLVWTIEPALAEADETFPIPPADGSAA